MSECRGLRGRAQPAAPRAHPVSPSGERILASGSVQLPRFTLLESGSLLVSPTRISDAGTYTCLATNSRGVDEASADLVVWGECAQCLHTSVRGCVPSTVSPCRHLHTRTSVPPGALLPREGLGRMNDCRGKAGLLPMVPRGRGLSPRVAE